MLVPDLPGSDAPVADHVIEAAEEGLLPEIERQIGVWHGIAAPNRAARVQAGQLAETIEGYARLRGEPRLEAAPGDLRHALLAAREREDLPSVSGGSSPLAAVGLAGEVGRLRAGEVRSADLLAAALGRIAQVDAGLNAVVWQCAEAARAQAARCDRGGAGALHGVPLAHKDLFGIAGQRQTAGSELWRDHYATVTSTVLARLAEAGSYSFAGLSLAEFAQNPTGHNAAFGDCINPWNAAMITGGSSSGSAVAVAAGYCTGSLGTDTGGSIRLPAACCGVTGLKPTYGRVSRAGVVPLCASLDCVGPIARTALDCATLMDVIAGADPDDPTCEDLPVAHVAALDGDVRGQRIGVPVNWFCDEAAPEILEAYHAALGVLEARGARLVRLEVPLLDAIATYGGTMARVEAAALHAGWMRTQPGRYVTHVSARLYPGYAIPATYYVEAMQARPTIIAAFVRAVFGQVDVLATPTLRSRAPSRAETDVDVGPPGSETRFFAVGGNVRPFNYLGLPALSLPCGMDANGVPIGLQLVGRPFAEPRLLRVADAYQREVGPPPLPRLGLAAP
jgi:aspartyl-tRNA(Asn)/glutamyl-tRNA(Gln) amidotransferase subunit A